MTEPDIDISKSERDPCLQSRGAGPTMEPDWTRGLKRLYDQVLKEPVPDAFRDLLARLDDDTKR